MHDSLNTRTTLLLILPLCALLVAFFVWPLALVGWNSIFNSATGALTLHAYRELSSSTLFYRVGVIIGMTNYMLPFMVFPIMASLLSQNESVQRVAEIMGAGPVRIFLRITLPLSLPGVLAGVLMNMTLAMGMYITPALLGGRRDMMMANLVDFYTRQTLDWNLASAIAIVLLALSGI